jgi:uncharacterized protein YbbC (DUF1343 family)
MVQLGIEVLLTSRRDLLQGKRVGLVSNYTMTDRELRSVIDLLAADEGWRLTTLFGPEHGLRTCAKEGEHVASAIDPHTGLMAHSLYGETRKPSPAMLSEVDVLVIDLQDIGCRYYTNMSTMALCMEACAELGLPCLVLDRPNPLGGVEREGNILEPAFRSFVGMHPIPNRHGLTLGELALFINERLRPPCPLSVLPLAGWRREMLWADTSLPFVPPSPNTTGPEMCLLYPGTCLFEGTNLSVGRGTARPFEVIGAPYLDGHRLAAWFNEQGLPGVRARACYFVPTYSEHAGEMCQGVQLHVIDARRVRPVRTGLLLMQGIAELYPHAFDFRPAAPGAKPFIDLLAGTDRVRQWVLEGRVLDLLDEAEDEVARFDEQVQPYLLY